MEGMNIHVRHLKENYLKQMNETFANKKEKLWQRKEFIKRLEK